MFDAAAPNDTDLALRLPAEAYWHLIRTLRLTLPPPLTGDPEDLLGRDHAAIARIAGLAPANAAEADLAAQFVAASEQWKDCLRLAQLPEPTPERAAKCRAQANAMMRQSLAALRLLLRMQELRGKREANAAAGDRAAWTEHCAARLMAEALSGRPENSTGLFGDVAGPPGADRPRPGPLSEAEGEGATSPLPPAAGEAGDAFTGAAGETADGGRGAEPAADLVAAAERSAAAYPERAASIRCTGRLPHDVRCFSLPEATLAPALIAARSPALAESRSAPRTRSAERGCPAAPCPNPAWHRGISSPPDSIRGNRNRALCSTSPVRPQGPRLDCFGGLRRPRNDAHRRRDVLAHDRLNRDPASCRSAQRDSAENALGLAAEPPDCAPLQTGYAPSMQQRCDLIIRDTTVFDGTGGPRFTADVGISGDRIAAVGDLGAATADRELPAAGMALAPGFIDAHTHDDRAVLCGAECMLCKMSQGVTTVVVGNCGISLSPARLSAPPPPPLDLIGEQNWWRFDSFGEYADELARNPPPVNTLALIGHMSLRIAAMAGDTGRPATDREAARMQTRLAEALAEGASGFSTGLYYPPNRMAPTEEVIAVAEALRTAGGLYVTHMRDEADDVLASIEEALRIGRAVGAPVVISHHKCTMPENFGRSAETLPRIAAAAREQRVAFDIYPYSASSTVLLPEKMRPDVPVKITWSVPHPELAGRFLAAIAAEWGVAPEEAARRLVPAGGIYFSMDEQDVRRILAHELSMIGSDGLPHDAFPHPRLWGTFPRVLGHYARDLGLFSLETAVRKMTGRTAEVFGLADRGVIRPGAFADLVLFDPAAVRDTADFDQPIRPADGILETWVNGRSAYVFGQGATPARAGRLVRRERT